MFVRLMNTEWADNIFEVSPDGSGTIYIILKWILIPIILASKTTPTSHVCIYEI